VEAGDFSPEAALARELREELSIEIAPSALTPLTFASADVSKKVHLLMPLFVSVDRWRGELRGAEGQEIRWVSASDLADYPMPPADNHLVPAVRQALLRSRKRAAAAAAAAAGGGGGDGASKPPP